MKVEVWSDMMCPFCYIGKKNYEKALSQFSGAGEVELEWKSFQLDPEIPKGQSYPNQIEYLASRKGMALGQVKEMQASVAHSAAQAGIVMDFEKVVITNTLDAHRLLHFAKTKGLANAMKERLFRAHFTEGMNVGDPEVLAGLAESVGLNRAEVESMLDGPEFAYDVAQDVQEAGNIGVRGVPFFVFNRKYAIPGAQPVEAFLQTLEKSFGEWKEAQSGPTLKVSEGPSCAPDTGCV